MPVLGAYPVVSSLAEVDTALDETRTLALRGLDGTYPFPAAGREFFFLPDIEGIDYPTPEIVRKRIPGEDGERIVEIRVPSRDIFLPLWIASESSHLAYLARRDALASLFTHLGVDYRSNDGTLDLVATSARGERTLRCVYVSGMDKPKWPNEGATWAKLPINLLAVRPYWYGERWATPVIRAPAGVDTFAGFPLVFSSSVALGADIPVTIPGDAGSWITVDLVGPSTSVTVEGNGLLFSIPASLADGEKAHIVTDVRGRTAEFDGVKDWSRIGPTTTWAPLSPGDQLLSITVAGTGGNTQAQVSGWSRYQRPW